jgi:hypothetical protein
LHGIGGVTALAELHAVVDQLPPADVEMMLVDARARLNLQPRTDREPFAWAGVIEDGPADLSSPERIDAMLTEGFGHR